MQNTLEHGQLVQPFLFEARAAHDDGVVQYGDGGVATVVVPGEDPVTVSLSQQFDLTQATLFGLNERLTSAATSPVMHDEGATLRELFEQEWQTYSDALIIAQDTGIFSYGWYAWYPRQQHLVRYASPFWHRVVSIASSSTLLLDPAYEMTWKQVRHIFERTVIGVVGCSVGNAITHTCVMDIRPHAIKVADKSLYKMENINRVRLSYDDIVQSQAGRQGMMSMGLRKKAQVVADQLLSIDPFMNVFVYDDGVQQETITSFFDGSKDEPSIDILIEEVDEPRIKLLLREEARRRGVPVVMASDLGSCVQVDVTRYDKDHTLPLAYGVSDDELYAAMEAVYDHPGDRDRFFAFVDALVGDGYRTDELERIINLEAEIPTATIIPQLGSTATTGAGVVAEIVARIRLGHDVPTRVRFDKKTLTCESIA